MKIVIILLSIVLGLALAITIYFTILGKRSQAMTPALGVEGNLLKACASELNCVTSVDEKSPSFYPPYKRKVDAHAFSVAAEREIVEMGGEVKVRQDGYIKAEFKSGLFGFVDDLELLAYPEENTTVHVRSASRVGKSDLGVNRKRLDALKARLAKVVDQE